MSIKYVENGDADKVFYLSENKKNIFLIGDSIREGYCEIVKNEFLLPSIGPAATDTEEPTFEETLW